MVRFLELLPMSFVTTLFVLFRYVPFNVGCGIRYCCLVRLCRRCGENIAVFPGAFISFLENCVLGSSISIHENCNIGCKGGIFIGDNVMISQGVSILTTEHEYKQTSMPMRDAPLVLKETRIENDVWIGANAVITAGVTVNTGALIAAGAVVTRDVPTKSIVGGIPARIIATR